MVKWTDRHSDNLMDYWIPAYRLIWSFCFSIFVCLDVSFPLAGDVQRSVGICSASANQASPAILDVVDNMRAKIYALLHRIGK